MVTIAELNHSHEECDLEPAGVLCTDSFTGALPAVFDLGIKLSTA